VARILFVTGTDTGVGKTLVAASLLFHLRRQGVRALAMKPFCSGSRDDVRLLQAIQCSEISDEEVNPFYFAEPVAPLVAARKTGKKIPLQRVVDAIMPIARRCDHLIVEGAGGLLAPLGPNYSAADLIKNLKCSVCVVAENRLGAINHSLLTVRLLQTITSSPLKLLLTQITPRADAAMRANRAVISELAAPISVLALPYVGRGASTLASIQRNHPKTGAVWDAILLE